MTDPTALAKALLFEIETKSVARAERLERILAAYETAYDAASTADHKLAVMANYGEGALSILTFGERDHIPALIAEIRRLRTHAETVARDARRKAFEEAAQIADALSKDGQAFLDDSTKDDELGIVTGSCIKNTALQIAEDIRALAALQTGEEGSNGN